MITVGNLGRAGYGASTEGLWPYSYDSCDVGTLPNQTYPGTLEPEVAYTTGNDYDNFILSYLPGQRLSACTCSGQTHPGPSNNKGRAAPEIDVLEAQIDPITRRGHVSQSLQVAPFNAGYLFDNTTSIIYNADLTTYNTYLGGVFQQAISAITDLGTTHYYLGDNTTATYAFEYWYNVDKRSEGFVTWDVDGVPSWTALASSTGPDINSGVGARIIPEEPLVRI